MCLGTNLRGMREEAFICILLSPASQERPREHYLPLTSAFFYACAPSGFLSNTGAPVRQEVRQEAHGLGMKLTQATSV